MRSRARFLSRRSSSSSPRPARSAWTRSARALRRPPGRSRGSAGNPGIVPRRADHGPPGSWGCRRRRSMKSEEWDKRYAGQELVWTAEPNRFVVAELKDLAPGRALDLGAGEGRNAVWLASAGWQVTAVDFSAVGLDKGRRLAENRA